MLFISSHHSILSFISAAVADSYPAVNHLAVKELLHLIGGGNAALKALL